MNGQNITLAAAPDIRGLLDTNGYAGKIVAVARNGAFVPKAAYEQTQLEDGDELEIVAPMQGG
ncbi:MAG: sulfur carrier protein ThiS [Alphaproteobacteria bacterium]